MQIETCKGDFNARTLSALARWQHTHQGSCPTLVLDDGLRVDVADIDADTAEQLAARWSHAVAVARDDE